MASEYFLFVLRKNSEKIEMENENEEEEEEKEEEEEDQEFNPIGITNEVLPEHMLLLSSDRCCVFSCCTLKFDQDPFSVLELWMQTNALFYSCSL